MGVKGLPTKVAAIKAPVRRVVKSAATQIIVALPDEFLDILYFFEKDADTPSTSERKHRKETAAAIKKCLGDTPLKTFADMTARRRKNALIKLHVAISEALGIDAPVLSFIDMDDYYGQYFSEKDTVVINERRIKSKVIKNAEAKEIIGTLCHELYHAFQFKAILNPAKYGISKTRAKIWKKNYAKYISHEESYQKYRSQPIESTAYKFESAIKDKI